jgi:cytochrome oxidase assembly protein ShyY1
VVRTLLTPRWLLALLLAVAFAAVCVVLGRWQWGRYEDKRARGDAIAAHYMAAPVPLDTMVPRLPLSEADEWTRVTATGPYAGQQLLVRNRSLSSTPGLEVVVPLDTGGHRLLVDRGWVENAESAAQLPAVPPAPDGTVTVQGWLRHGEADLGKDLPAGQLASINISNAQAQVGGELLDAYLVLESERTAMGAVPPRPAPLEKPEGDLGPHQAYAFQWWLTSGFGFVLLGHRLLESRRLDRTADGDRQPGQVPATSPPRKVRIWDEEDA